MRRQTASAAMVSVVLCAPAFSGVVAHSNFDAGPDGWTFPASVEWHAVGGNGDGYLHGSVSEDENITAVAFASAAFLGNWSAFDGTGVLTYDYRRMSNGEVPLAFFPLTVQIAGPGGNATWTGATITQPGDWFTVTVPINSANWSIDDGSWASILANVTTLAIHIELVVNEGSLDDQAGIDNVTLVPNPATAAVLVLALAALRRRR